MRKFVASAVLLPCAGGAGRQPADFRRAPALQPWTLEITAAGAEAIAILRKAGLKRADLQLRATTASSGLPRWRPTLRFPSLRPYRSRGEIGSWFRDERDPHLEDRLKRYRYAGDREVSPLRRRRRPAGAAPHGAACAPASGLFLHAHSDVEAVERLLKQWLRRRGSCGRIRASTGRKSARGRRASTATCGATSRSAPTNARGGKVDPGWRAAFLELPDRFSWSAPTSFTPVRWHCIGEHAKLVAAMARRPGLEERS